MKSIIAAAFLIIPLDAMALSAFKSASRENAAIYASSEYVRVEMINNVKSTDTARMYLTKIGSMVQWSFVQIIGVKAGGSAEVRIYLPGGYGSDLSDSADASGLCSNESNNDTATAMGAGRNALGIVIPKASGPSVKKWACSGIYIIK